MQRCEAIFFMHDVEVDVLGLKPLQTGVAGSEDMTARQTRLRDGFSASKAHFRRYDKVLSAFPKQFPQHDLGLTLCISIGCVEKIYAGVQTSIHERASTGCIDLHHRRESRIGPESHRSKGDPRND
jgi:hypothetical protein